MEEMSKNARETGVEEENDKEEGEDGKEQEEEEGEEEEERGSKEGSATPSPPPLERSR